MPTAEVHMFAGIDVSGHELSVALRNGQGDQRPALAKFPNHPSGHKALIAYLVRRGGRVRVCLEASGNYSLDVALTLHAHRQVEVSVINPRRARRFAESLGERSKTDPVDARVLCEYAARMPWRAAKLCPPWLSRKCSVISVIWSIAWNGYVARLSVSSHGIAS